MQRLTDLNDLEQQQMLPSWYSSKIIAVVNVFNFILRLSFEVQMQMFVAHFVFMFLAFGEVG